jgi:membrane-associated phospholipid phosphatase
VGQNGAITPTLFALIVAAVAGCLLLAAVFTRGRVALVLVAAGLSALLGALTVGMNADWLVSIDTALENWSDKHRTDRRGELAVELWRFLGDPLHALIAAVLSGSLLSLRMRSPVALVLVTGAVGVGVGVEETLKATIYPHSFPSGHVTVATTLFGMIAVCLAAGDSRLAKVSLGFLVAESVLVVVGLAIFTGAHTFADLLGGMVLGTAILAWGAVILDFTRRQRPRTTSEQRPVAPPPVIRTPARAAVGGRPEWASPGRPPLHGHDDITRPLPRL